MLTGILFRGISTPQGTPGKLFLNNLICYTMELPWKDNLPQISCIPEGSYLCEWKKSPKFGYCYHIKGVPNRGNILVHPGTFAGSEIDGWRTHSHGCLLPCTRIGKMDGQLAGLLSLPMVKKIAGEVQYQPFKLEIRSL